jgi:hypothetical protein
MQSLLPVGLSASNECKEIVVVLILVMAISPWGAL